jgi:putative transposase
MKRSYHSDIIIQYKLGMLAKEVIKQIPSSTIDNWKNRDTCRLFGLDYVHDFQDNFKMMKDIMAKKSLLKAAKAVYFIYCSYVKVMDTVKNKHKIFRQSKDIVINTIDRVKDIIGQKRAMKAFGISYQQFYAWKNKITCKLYPVVLCRKKYHNQLTAKEVNTISEYLKKPEFRHWSITSVFFQILREKAAFFSQTTFYNYVNRLQLQRAKPEKKKYYKGIRADGPKKILHADVTIYRPLDHSRVYLYFLVDNFSRFILTWKASLEYSAKIAFENISEAYNKYDLGEVPPYIELITDGGSENKGAVEDFVNRPNSNILKLIAQTDTIFSNSMVEAVNKRIKYDFLFTVNLLNIEQVKIYLSWAVDQYNKKHHSALLGLTPNEVFNGMLPDKDMFKPAMKQAAIKRKEINMGQDCLNCIEKEPENQNE